MFGDLGDVLDYMDAMQQEQIDDIAADLTEELNQDFDLKDTDKDGCSLEKINEWMKELDEADFDEEKEYERWEQER